MKSRLIILTLASLHISAWMQAQTIQQGIAYRYNGAEPRTPLGMVTITYDANQRTAISDPEDGTFSLALAGRKMGDRIGMVTVKKREMMVFNQHAVDEWSVRKEPLVLILCNADEFEKQKDNLIEIGRREARKKYESQKAELQARLDASLIKQAEYEAALNKAYEERQNLLENIGEYADLFARIDESEIDSSAQQAINLFNQGKIEEAISLFEQGNYLDKLDKAMATSQQADRLKALAEKTKSEATQDSLLALQSLTAQIRAYMVKNDWQKAGEMLKGLADRLNAFDASFGYAYYCSKLNRFQESIDYYHYALRLAADIPETYELYAAITQNNLATLYMKINRLDEAEQMYFTVLETYRRLAIANQEAFEPEIAQIQHNLACLYSDIKRYDEAEKMYLKALETRQRLAIANPETYEPDVAQSLNNLGILYKDTRRFDEAEQVHLKALEVRQRIATANPEGYSVEAEIAQTQNNLANLYSNTGRIDQAESMYLTALDTYQRLAVLNPEAYEPDVAKTQNNLGVLYEHSSRYIESEQMYLASLETRQRLAIANPEAYEQDVAATQNNLANLYFDTQRSDEAEQMYLKALGIYQRLAIVSPEAFEPDAAMMQYNLGSFYKDAGRYIESEKMYLSALHTYQRLASVNPEAFGSNVAAAQHFLASLYYNTGRIDEAEQMYLAVLETCRRFAIDNPEAFESKVADTQIDLGSLYSETQRFDEAEQIYLSALETFRRLADVNPEAYEPDVAATSYCIGLLRIDGGKYTDAISSLDAALAIYRKLILQNPSYRLGYESSLYWLSNLYAGANEYADEYRINQELLPLMKEHVADDADEWGSSYAEVLGGQSFCAIMRQNYAEAEQLSREGLSVDPSIHWIASNLAAALLFQGKYDEAEAVYKQYKDELKESFLDDFSVFDEAGVIPKKRESDVERIKNILWR